MNFNKRVNGSWADTPHYIHNTSTDTITTLPADIYVNDTTATVGLKGNMSQTGTPTQQNPIQPSECGERTGNLCPETSFNKTTELYHTITFVEPLPVGTYTISANITPDTGISSARLSFRKSDLSQEVATNITIQTGRSTVTITISNPCSAIYFYGGTTVMDNIPIKYDDIMLNTGSTALPYEPYGYKIPISSGGENLWDGNYENGLINTDGTLNAPNVNYNTTMYIPTEEKNYTLSVICNYDLGLRLLRVCFYDENKNFISYVDSPGFRGEDFFYKFNFTAPVNSKYLRFSYIFKVGMSDTNIMLNLGSEALPYSPYNRTTTPVYLGEVPTTRRIKKLVLTGNETWERRDNCFRLSCPDSSNSVGTIISTHFKYSTAWALINTTSVGACVTTTYYGTSYKFLMVRCDDIATTVADFKTYLQQQYANGTPVTVWYVLATPETAVVNEPLRKIGDYADTVSGITIPTIAGANTLSIGTALQPSEVTVNYKGWHPVADVHEADNGAWT